MHGSTSPASFSAGQRTSDSPDYAPPDSPRESLFVTLHLPPSLLQAFPPSGDNEDDDLGNGEKESLADSSKDHYSDEFEDDLTGEVYDNYDQKPSSEPDEELDVADQHDDQGHGVMYQSIEYDEMSGSQLPSSSHVNHTNQPGHNRARDASVTQAESAESLAKSSTSKLLASCLDIDQPFFYDYLAQRRTLAVDFLERNNEVLEQFLTRHPDFIQQFLRRNYRQAISLFADDPRWFIENFLRKYPYLVENYLTDHPESVERFIHAHPVHFDRYLAKHPEFAINYLHFNRLPSGYGLAPDMFGVTQLLAPPESQVRTPSPALAGLPSPDSSPPAPPPPPAPADPPARKSTARKTPATKKPPAKSASRAQQPSTKAAPGHSGLKTKQRPVQSAVASASAIAPSSSKKPITPESAPKKTTGPSRSKSTTATATAVAASSSSSSSAQTYKVILTSAYNQPAGQFMNYPAPSELLAASTKQEAGTKGSWRLFEEDRAIKHMFDVRDEGHLAGETRFQEVSDRLKKEGIDRGFFAVKNYWNRTGRARSGFDERKNKTAPLATSKQGKAFRKGKKAQSKKRKGKGVDGDSEDEDDDDDEDGSEGYSVHSEEETTPSPPPTKKRPADFDDAALAKAQSYGTRPKKTRVA